MSSSTTVANSITLRGSTAIVCEFFGYAVNSILFQRGVYPADTFRRINKYGLTILISDDKDLNKYLSQVMSQLNNWLMTNDAQKMVLVITGAETHQTLERWVFNIETTDIENTEPDRPRFTKPENEIAKEIASIIRQITGSVTFLPMLQERCTFDLLVYCRKDISEVGGWEDTSPQYILNGFVTFAFSHL